MKTTTFRVQLCVIICTFLFFTNAFSQGMMKEIPFGEQVQGSQQIIEGKVISKKSFWDINHHNIYTVNTVAVYKVFKGDVLSFVNVVTSGGVIGLEMETVEPSLQLNVGETGIFMLNSNNISLQNDTATALKFKAFGSSQGFYRYDQYDGTASNPFHKKTSITESLYPELQSLTGASFQVVTNYDVSDANNRQGSISISSISPTTVTAGTQTTITISGSGFGTVQGTVGFSDADVGGSSYFDGLPTQVVSWNDTEIVVEVPDRAGTGTVRVVNDATDTAISGQTLTVSYAQLNVEFDPGTGQEAYQTQHVNRDGSGGYVWQMQTDFDANTAANDAFVRALDTWRCETDVNWTIGSVTTTDVVANDDINIIRFDNDTELPIGVLGRCTSRWSGCIVGGTNISWYVEELDISFNDTTNWNFSTSAPSFSQYDFESVAVHELGHGHQLGHVIDNGAIMHYAISNGSFNRTLSANDIAGASDVQSRSTSTAVCGQSVMVDFDCSTLSVSSFDLASQFNIYPNPAKHELFIKNTSNYNLEDYVIYDLSGKIILQEKLKNTMSNIINIGNLSSGVYFIHIKTDGGDFTQKVVKE